jgi:FixJ family two-component response regulator
MLDPSNQNAVDLLEKPAETRRSLDASAKAGDSEKGNRGEARKQSRRTEKTTGARQIQNNLKKGNWRQGGGQKRKVIGFRFWCGRKGN